MELPPTGGQPGPILAILPQAGEEDPSLQASFLLIPGGLGGVIKWIVAFCHFKSGLVLILFLFLMQYAFNYF